VSHGDARFRHEFGKPRDATRLDGRDPVVHEEDLVSRSSSRRDGGAD
jgi:hypothetical protein